MQSMGQHSTMKSNDVTNPAGRLRHMLFHIDGMERETVGYEYDGFKGNYALERIVERAIQIIAEAAEGLADDLKERFPDVPWKRIAGIADILQQDYHHVDAAMLWDAVESLPDFRRAVVGMLAVVEEADDIADDCGRGTSGDTPPLAALDSAPRR